jgi:hypothetical protein
MASTVTIFNSFRKYAADGTIDLDTDTVKAALITSAYTVNATHTILADISANEVSNGAGYTTGGATLTTPSVTYSGAVAKFSADPALWLALTKTFRFVLLYANVTRNAVVNPLIAIILIDNTPNDIVVTAADYSIQWSASGIVTFS